MISIEANIGSGKSTLLNLIKNQHSKLFNVINEPVEEWQNTRILSDFYDNQERWSYTFQSNAFITRIQKYERECNPELINLSERSVVSDNKIFAKMLKDSGKITDSEWDLYINWFNWLVNKFNCKPKAIIYLRTDPVVSYNRIKKRSRNEETNIDLDYIKSVHNYHDNWLLNEKNIPVLVLNVTEDFENNSDNFNNIITQLNNFVEENKKNLFH